MADEPNHFEKIFAQYAERLNDAPGANLLARLARTAKRIPDALSDELAALILKLDDVQLAGSDIAIHLVEIGYCGVRYRDAVEFASELATRLQSYVDDAGAASAARADFKERVSWWQMALSRTTELCRWPAMVLNEMGGR